MTSTPFSAVLLGGPGLGKSTLAGSITAIVPPKEVLLMVAKPGEEKSYKYLEAGLTERAELYYDKKWKPSLESFEAGAFIAMMKRLQGLLDDTSFGAIIIDPGTDVINLLEHHLLSPNKVGSPGDLKDTMGFYRQLKDLAQEFVATATVLSTSLAKRPKYVIIPWHVQPSKEGQLVKDPSGAPGAKVKVASGDEKGSGVEYEGNVLPMLEGAYRRKLAADFDLVVYCDIAIKKDFAAKTEVVSYVVQVTPNNERHAKARMFKTLPVGMLANDFTTILKAMGGQV